MSTEHSPPDKPEEPSLWREYMKYSDAGIKFAVCIVLGVFGGEWLGQRFGFRDLFTILGMFFGASIGMYSLYKSLFKE